MFVARRNRIDKSEYLINEAGIADIICSLKVSEHTVDVASFSLNDQELTVEETDGEGQWEIRDSASAMVCKITRSKCREEKVRQYYSSPWIQGTGPTYESQFLIAKRFVLSFSNKPFYSPILRDSLCSPLSLPMGSKVTK